VRGRRRTRRSRLPQQVRVGQVGRYVLPDCVGVNPGAVRKPFQAVRWGRPESPADRPRPCTSNYSEQTVFFASSGSGEAPEHVDPVRRHSRTMALSSALSNRTETQKIRWS
jgi:hypothetical protein